MAEEAGEQVVALAWDSTFWGFRAARVRGDALTPDRVRQIDGWCQRQGVRCLYFLARPDDPTTTRLAETNGFQFVDIRLTLERTWRALSVVDAGTNGDCVVIRHAHRDDLSALQRIARESHRDSRFYYDPGFPRALCDLLYVTWIRVDLDSTAAQIMVAEADGAVVGYMSCRLDDKREGRISLVAVDSQAQGKGIGKALMRCALDWFLANGATSVVVTTQGRNVAAQRLYQQSGFVTRAVQLWYHKWYSSP